MATRKGKGFLAGPAFPKIRLGDERITKLLGLVLLLFSLYLTVAFISYLFTWQIDQDRVLRFSWRLLGQGDIEMANSLGRLGAIVSNMFFFWGFGLSSFLFIPIFFKTGLSLLRNTAMKNWLPPVRNWLILMLCGSVLLQFIFRNFDFPFGGAFGQLVGNWLLNLLGTVGMILLILFILVGLFTWVFNPNFTELSPGGVFSDRKVYFSEMIFGKKAKRRREPQTAATDDNSLEEATIVEEGPTKTFTPLAPSGKRPFQVPATDRDSQLALDLNAKDSDTKSRSPLKVGEAELEIAYQEPPKLAETELEDITSAPPPPLPPGLAHATAGSNVSDDDDEFLEPNNLSEPYDPTLELSSYENPVLALLNDYEDQVVEVDRAELEANKDQIIETLLNYKIEIVKIRATIGPTVTLYEIVPAPGVRISRIKSLEDDIALSLAALGIRIIAPIPGKGTIGIEVPNKKKQIVSLKEVLTSDKFKKGKMDLPIALGKTISNEVFVADLTKMPHLLIAGATGQGKSVGINTVLMSLLYKKHPAEVKLILIDPKKVELFPYAKLDSHFLGYLPDSPEPIVTDTSKVISTLNSLCIEMDQRYNLLKKAHARNIKEYNEKFTQRRLNPNKGHQYLPFIVLVIDEFADLIMTAGKEVELPIGRLAQLSRAVGIHLIIATQRPSVNIITGVIKANFPARIAYKVSAKVDSRTILDAGGADQLIGRGDMLLSVDGDMIRLQCAFVDTPEVERVIDFIAKQRGFAEPYFLPEFHSEEEGQGPGSFSLDDLDDMIEDAARLVVQNQHGSTSMIQRRLKLGYNRAGRIMDQLEALGVVGPNEGSKPREVLIFDEMELERYLESVKNRK